MTLQELLNQLAANPRYIIFYFAMLPVVSLLAGWISKGEGHLNPWKYIFATLIYLAFVPGLFSITTSIYLFLFERRSIFQADVFTQILPIISLIATIWAIRQFVSLDDIPGFDKLSGLIIMIVAALGIMWIIDRTRILLFSYIRFELVIVIFAALLLAIRYGWGRLTRR